MVVLPLLGLLAGAGIAAALFSALAGKAPGSPAEAATLQQEQQQTGTTVTIDAEDYIGRPVGEVVDELTRLGLSVERRQVPTDDVVPDSVTGVDPDGVLEPDDTVVVSYAVHPGTGGTSDDGGGVTGAAVDPVGDTSVPATPTGEAGTTVPPTQTATGTGTGTQTGTETVSEGDGELPGEPVETGEVTDPATTTPTDPPASSSASEPPTSSASSSEPTSSSSSAPAGEETTATG